MLHFQYTILVKNNFKLSESFAFLIFRECREIVFLICPKRPAISDKMLQDVMSLRQARQPNFNF